MRTARQLFLDYPDYLFTIEEVQFELEEENQKKIRREVELLYSHHPFPLMKVKVGVERFGLIGASKGLDYKNQPDRLCEQTKRVKKFTRLEQISNHTRGIKVLKKRPRSMKYLINL